MATREECEAAGVEYIERPVSAEDLAELREDKERLDWFINQPDFVRVSTNLDVDDDFCEIDGSEHTEIRCAQYIGDSCEISRGASPREAIRAAMKGGA
ncbi:hypothetical protein DTO96_102429 [Ephemeroptericola cinctiostellae]|uniref:Uncharacterized protein n=1 Tax=Ephemeroptericola cinctiostellae TaxID=2268024 RepID=A0A345DE86_9BURK|nr:hypothetical protein [Ephemeroptericola cinctiostellae]AXF86674.1 hypothetical protein DTO96_102429 [Ephemeroptericola cinctiostellae]